MNIEYKNSLFIRVPKTASTSIICTYKRLIVISEARDYFKTAQTRPLYFRTQNYLNVMERIHDWFDIERNNIFTFGFVRNPWDRAVSSWKFGSHESSWNMNFVDFCRNLQKLELFPETKKAKNGLLLHVCEQHPFLICRDKGIKSDFIGRFENLQKDFNTICDKIGVARHQLPHKNKTNHRHYTEYYNKETRQIIAEKYAKDIEYFGYEFGK